MAIFVINEWLWADSSGENGLQAQREAFTIIKRLADSDHQIVVIEGSRFEQKAFSLCRSTNPMIVQRIAGTYMGLLRLNSARCRILKMEEAVQISEELATKTEADDRYLVQCLFTVPGAILVTTDRDLHEAVTKAGLGCLFREKFLANYF